MPLRKCLILFLALAALFGACEPAPGPVSKQQPQGRDILNINEKPRMQEEYVVEWGDTRIPLAKYANPEVYGGKIEVELEVFRQMLGRELRLLKQGKVLDAELVSIHRQPYRRFDPFGYSYPDLHQGRLEDSIIAAYREGIQAGELVSISIHALNEPTIVQSAVIKIKDPFEEYAPEVEVPRPRYFGDLFGFQLLQEEGRRPLLRIDTAAEHTRHIYELYAKNRLYKIIHIPAFKTRRRLLMGRDQLFATTEVRRSELLGEGHDWLTLPEFTDLGSSEVRLSWGPMEAGPSSSNYSLEEFRTSIRQPLRLWVGERELPIRSFHLLTASRGRLPERYVADSLHTPALLKVLYKLPPAGTVYFDKVIVEEGGQLMLFPQAFAFNIARSR